MECLAGREWGEEREGVGYIAVPTCEGSSAGAGTPQVCSVMCSPDAVLSALPFVAIRLLV